MGRKGRERWAGSTGGGVEELSGPQGRGNFVLLLDYAQTTADEQVISDGLQARCSVFKLVPDNEG